MTDFSIVNFTFMFINIPAAPANGLYILELIRFSRACIFRFRFLLTRKLLKQGFHVIRLVITSFFFVRQHDLVAGSKNPFHKITMEIIPLS